MQEEAFGHTCSMEIPKDCVFELKYVRGQNENNVDRTHLNLNTIHHKVSNVI